MQNFAPQQLLYSILEREKTKAGLESLCSIYSPSSYPSSYLITSTSKGYIRIFELDQLFSGDCSQFSHRSFKALSGPIYCLNFAQTSSGKTILFRLLLFFFK